MVPRYTSRKEPTMHCFIPQCAQPPAQPSPSATHHYTHPNHHHHCQQQPAQQAHLTHPHQMGQIRIITANSGRTDVGFHVAAGAQGFPQQPPQQGGGSGGPPQLGGGGNRMPPQQQQHAPSQQQVPPPQQQLPGPTSTPPGAEMGKGPHLQQAIPQGQIPSYGVQNAARQNPSQQFYQPRAPTTRISNHRTGPVVGMQANVGGQQMYPQHVQIPQMQTMYANVLPLTMGQTPMYSNHGLFQPRHNNQSTSAPFYAQPGQIMLHTYPSYNPGQPSASFAYYPQLAGRPSAAGAGPPGGPGGQQVGNPGVPGAGTQNVPMMPIGGAPTGSVVPGMAPGGSDVTGGPQQQGSVTSHPGVNQGGNKPKRKHAIDIVDPKTLQVVDVASDSKGSGTPPHSGESSARETPQPVPGAGLNLAADFAARVYKVANEEPSPPLQQSQLQQQAASFVPEHVLQQQVVNGPLVMEQPNEMGIQNSPVDSGNPPDKLNTTSSSSDVVPDVVLDVFRQQVQEHQAIPVVINKEVQEAGGTPVVSAKTNGPSVELVHRREPFPALKSTPAGTSSSSSSSPSRRKQQSTSAAVSSSEKPQAVASAPSAVFSQLGPALSTEAPVLTATQSTPEVPTCPTPKPPRDSAVAAPPAGSKLVTGAPAVPASAEPKTSLALSNMPHPGTVAASKKTGPPPQVDIPAFPSTAVVKDKSVISTSSRATKGPISSQSDPPPAVPRSSVGKPPARGPAAAVRSAKGVELPSATRQQTVVSTPPASARPVSRSPTPPVIPPVIEETKQQNGEHSEIITEGKATSKTKQKRNNQQKMKEINRKGAEKEGTDMDAFSEPPTAAPEEPIRPSPTQTPPLTSTTSTVGPASVPESVQAQPAPLLENQNSSKEKLQSDVEKDKMVAARNEANTKASVVSALKDKEKDEVIENIPPKTNAPLPLKHNYKEDQWSPNNPDGKKKYEREFLMQLQHTPQAKKKPDNIPSCCEAVLKDRLNKASRLTDISRGPHETFSPAFTKTTSFRAAPQKRGSQQGKAKNSSKPLISVSIKSDVKLHESENAWKPVRLRQKDNVDETAKTEELYKKVRGILNKLTPQKFQTLVSQVQSLPIDTNERLQGVIDLVFEKAVDEPSYSVAYAQMCKVLRTIQASGDNKDPSRPGQQDVNFQKLLLARCQTEFERNKGDAHRSEKLKEMEATTDPERKKELQIDLDEIERKLRMKSVGNVRFIGELFKLQMLTTNIMHSCIKHLLEARDEESLECLCKLLTTIGKELENKGQNLNEYFNLMRDISRQRGHVSSRVRFMLQDVIDLKAGNWVPRRDDSNPKTIDQIQKEAERESLDREIASIGNQPPMRGGRQDDRGGGGGDRRKHRGGSGVSEDGWHNVSGSRINRNVDPTKLRVKLPDLSESLGSMVQFESWGRGAGAVNSDSDRIQSFPHTSNAYSALSDMEDKKLNNPSNRSTKGKHGSSSSVERDRVVQSGGKKYIDNSNERYTVSGNGPHSSRSSSRESSSVRREEDLPSSQANAAVQPLQISVEPQAIEESRKLCAERSHSEVVQGTMCVLDEFIGNINYEETAQSIVEMFPPSNMADFVGECLNSMLERSTLNRVNVGRLLSHLINVKILTMEQFLSGFKIISEVADDLAIDVPKVWLYLAEILVPMICSEVLSFSELKTAAQGLHRLVVEILHLLVKDKGPLWVREKWDAAGIEWTDFISSPSEIDALIKENKLEFTVGPPGSVEPPQKATLPMEGVQVKLVQFLKQPSNVFDHLVNWITANVGADVKKPEFIRALMTAICEVAFNQNNSKKVDEAVLLKHQVLIQRYVDNDEELELHCLYAVQEFNYKLEQPQGLLCNIFHSLWDFNFISSDTFTRWESSEDPAFQQGKGIALKSLTTFFTALREGEDDDSEES